MIDQPVYIVLTLIALCLVLYGLFAILKQPFRNVGLKQRLSLKQIRYFEKSLIGLKEIIILRESFPSPMNELLHSAHKNLFAGIKYTFLISNKTLHYESNPNYIAFKQKAMAIKKPLEKMLSVNTVDFEYKHNSYVFYKFYLEKTKKTIVFSYVAEKDAEFSENYELIPSTIASGLLELALQNNREARDEIYDVELTFENILLSA